MPSQDALYTIVHARFHDAFGTPHAVEGGGEQWSLFPPKTRRLGIHVLLNGSPWSPGVWVFDPHDATGSGVENTLISNNEQIDDIIQRIWQRLDRIDDQSSGMPPAASRRRAGLDCTISE